MREIITYVAYDDTEFDNLEDCEEYESKAFDLLIEFFNAYDFFGKNGEYIWIFLNEVEQGLYAIKYAFERCEKIRVKKIVSHEVRELIDSYFGYELPWDEVGLYEYDWKEMEWIKVGEQPTLIFC